MSLISLYLWPGEQLLRFIISVLQVHETQLGENGFRYIAAFLSLLIYLKLFRFLKRLFFRIIGLHPIN